MSRPNDTDKERETRITLQVIDRIRQQVSRKKKVVVEKSECSVTCEVLDLGKPTGAVRGDGAVYR